MRDVDDCLPEQLKAELLAEFDDYCVDRAGRKPSAAYDLEVRKSISILIDKISMYSAAGVMPDVVSQISGFRDEVSEIGSSLNCLEGFLHADQLNSDAAASIVSLGEGITGLVAGLDGWELELKTSEMLRNKINL